MTRAALLSSSSEPSAESEIARVEIAALLKQLNRIYAKTGTERARLSAQQSPFDGGELHGEIEIFADDIGGYATSISARRKIKNPFKAMRWLMTNHGTRLIAQLRRAPRNYPRLEEYAADSDHLRRLVIEYLERYA